MTVPVGIGSRRMLHLSGMMQSGGRRDDCHVSEPLMNRSGKALCRRRAALPSLLRNDLARLQVNHFRPDLNWLALRNALSPAAATRGRVLAMTDRRGVAQIASICDPT